MEAWKGSGLFMDKLKDGSISFRQALTLGDAGALEGWVVCSVCVPSCLVPSWPCWGSQGEEAALSVATRERCVRVLPSRKAFDFSPPNAVPDRVLCLPRAGCPRERPWEAVELASAAGEAGLPVSLC